MRSENLRVRAARVMSMTARPSAAIVRWLFVIALSVSASASPAVFASQDDADDRQLLDHIFEQNAATWRQIESLAYTYDYERVYRSFESGGEGSGSQTARGMGTVWRDGAHFASRSRTDHPIVSRKPGAGQQWYVSAPGYLAGYRDDMRSVTVYTQMNPRLSQSDAAHDLRSYTQGLDNSTFGYGTGPRALEILQAHMDRYMVRVHRPDAVDGGADDQTDAPLIWRVELFDLGSPGGEMDDRVAPEYPTFQFEFDESKGFLLTRQRMFRWQTELLSFERVIGFQRIPVPDPGGDDVKDYAWVPATFDEYQCVPEFPGRILPANRPTVDGRKDVVSHERVELTIAALDDATRDCVFSLAHFDDCPVGRIVFQTPTGVTTACNRGEGSFADLAEAKQLVAAERARRKDANLQEQHGTQKKNVDDDGESGGRGGGAAGGTAGRSSW